MTFRKIFDPAYMPRWWFNVSALLAALFICGLFLCVTWMVLP